MPKQYAFWLKPNGEKANNRKDNAAPRKLLSSIVSSGSVDSAGVTSWGSIDPILALSLINSAVLINDENGKPMNQYDSGKITRNAISILIREKNSFKDFENRFLNHANDLAAEFIRKKESSYVLVTTLSIKQLPCKQLTINNSRISQLPKKNKFTRHAVVSEHDLKTYFANHTTTTKYATVRVGTAGRSVYEAAAHAFESINLLRGLWNLIASYRQPKSGFMQPVGIIHLGPIQTLHFPNGDPVLDEFWYQPEYRRDFKIFDPKNDWPRIDSYRIQAMRKLGTNRIGNEVRKLIVRYAEAISEPDMNVALLKFWSLLETITCTDRHEQTVSRASGFFEDAAKTRDALECIRIGRNQFVHASANSADSESTVNFVKLVVDTHLGVLIFNRLSFSSLEEYGSFLALPTDAEALKKRILQCRKALNIRTQVFKN